MVEDESRHKLQDHTVTENRLILIVNQLIELQLVIQLIFTDLPVASKSRRIDYDWNVHVFHVESFT